MKYIFLLLLISVNLLGAQKIVKKTIISHDVTSIQIDAKNCFEIRTATSESNEIRIEAIIDGEYRNDLILKLREKGTSILVSAGFAPNFKGFNDKLSAHKVISIALQITAPQLRNVQVDGTNCNVIAKGIYEQLNITLNDGSCTLKDVSASVTATTQSGDINVHSKGAEISATSKFGTVKRNDIKPGKNHFVLRTTTGNIHLSSND